MTRPVDDKFPVSQLFAGLATRGVVGRPDGSEVEYLVWLYGDYQPYGHAGVDIACPVGTTVRAMRAGTVVYAGWGEDLPGDDSWGPSGYFSRWGMYKNFPGIVTVIKADGANEFDIYGHQSDNDAVSVGMHVADGQVIGKSGDTKTRTDKVGPHLHVVTVSDPVNYATDWPRLIFGCVDPTPLFGNTGLVLQGAITNAATQFQEDDDMPYSEADLKRIIGEAVQESHTVTRENVIKTVTENTEAQHVETRKQILDVTQAQQDVTRGWLADRIKEASPADLAATINAAGIAHEVYDEIGKLFQGGK